MTNGCLRLQRRQHKIPFGREFADPVAVGDASDIAVDGEREQALPAQLKKRTVRRLDAPRA